jgi:hypothetical protein
MRYNPTHTPSGPTLTHMPLPEPEPGLGDADGDGVGAGVNGGVLDGEGDPDGAGEGRPDGDGVGEAGLPGLRPCDAVPGGEPVLPGAPVAGGTPGPLGPPCRDAVSPCPKPISTRGWDLSPGMNRTETDTRNR